MQLGRNGTGNYAGVAYLYKLPESDDVRNVRVRLDHPPLEEKADGTFKEQGKYLTSRESRNNIYFPRDVTNAQLQDPAIPVVIVEGEKKAIALQQHAWHGLSETAEKPRFVVLGLAGVDGWRGRIGKGPGPKGDRRDVRGVIADFDRIAWKRRPGYVFFDSNTAINEQVRTSRDFLARVLAKRGACVRIVDLPQRPGVNGPDDLLALDGPEAVLELIENARSIELPTIKVFGGSLAVNVRDAEKHLAAQTLREPAEGIFQRSGMLVRVARLGTATAADGIRREAGALQILSVGTPALGVFLNLCADWQKRGKKKDDPEWMPTDAPERIAKALSDPSVGWPNLPRLAGIIEAPTLRDDGSLLQTLGYDEATGLYFNPGGTVFPAIPEKPTRTDAEAALETLKAIVSGFPFDGEPSRAVLLAALLTPLVRHALRAAPMSLLSAPKPASGKTLASYLPAYIATGKPPALMSQAEKPEEEKKRLLALLLSGSVVSVIDNVERPLASEALCTILTEPEWTERLLGVNANRTVSTATTWLATGNNLRVAGDLSSRVLLCSIDPEVEHPEERKFPVNLHEYVPRHRGELAAAALTIVRAYLVSGDRIDVPVFGRFEDWSRFVREPLVWLGMADPCETRKAVEEKDSVRENLSGLLATWHDAFGPSGKTLVEVRRECALLDDPHVRDEMAAQRIEQLQALRAAMAVFADDKGAINARRLGNFIAKHERRIEGGLRFERDGDRQRSQVWRVEEK